MNKKNAKIKRKWGDRKDARWVRDVTGLQCIMAHLMPNRADCEVHLHDTFDATELVKYLAAKNEGRTDNKITIFHCFVAALNRMVRERPLMNRFVQGGRTYERYDISTAFVAKRRFKDGAEESLMFMVFEDDDTIDTICKKIVGDVKETRKSEHSTGGVDGLMDSVAKFPRIIVSMIVGLARTLDYWGHNLDAFTAGDPNYASIFLSNLGSIKCPAVYHHLNNYGSNSLMMTIGELHKEQRVMPDGTVAIRDVVEIGVTLDERIADGFYFARSLKLVKHMFEKPELFDVKLSEPSGYEYK